MLVSLRRSTATPSGGSGSYTSYQWYVNGSAQSGQTASTFSYSPASAGSYSITVTVTDSSGATSAQSTAASVTVNSALVAPTVTPTPGTVDQGQTSSLTSTAVSTGTSPYTYQWFEKAPGGSYVTVGSNSGSFSFATSGSTATGSWSFILQVTDNTGAAVNSTAVSVTVNSAPTVSIAPVGPVTLDAGQAQTFTASASGGTGTLTYQWYLNGSLVGVDSNTYIFSESAGSYSVTCTVTDSASVPASAASNAVSVTVNQLTITVTQGANGVIAPGTTTVNYGGSQTFTITPNTGYYIASLTVDGSPVTVASSYTFSNVQAAYTISATFEPNPTPTPSPTLTATSTPAPTLTTTPTPTTPSPTPTPTATTVSATTGSGTTVDLAISGNITSAQMSNVKIATNQSAASTTVSFTVTGESGTTGFSNITIPKSAITYGTTPTIYIDGQPAQDQGYTQDTNNYYVWYTTSFSTHQVSIVFTTTPNNTPLPSFNPGGPNRTQAQSSLPQEEIYGVAAAVVIVACVAVLLVFRKRKKDKS